MRFLIELCTVGAGITIAQTGVVLDKDMLIPLGLVISLVGTAFWFATDRQRFIGILELQADISSRQEDSIRKIREMVDRHNDDIVILKEKFQTVHERKGL